MSFPKSRLRTNSFHAGQSYIFVEACCLVCDWKESGGGSDMRHQITGAARRHTAHSKHETEVTYTTSSRYKYRPDGTSIEEARTQ